MLPELIDTHLHLYDEDDPAAIMAAARETGVRMAVAVGTDLDSSRAAATIAASVPGYVATAGVHPHDAAKDWDLAPFRELLARPEVVAVGEIGLDYYYEHSPREPQKRLFAHFLKLAADTGTPAVIHCRDAYEDCLQILRDHLQPGQPFEVHSYTGTPEWVREVLDMGAYVSVNGIVTFNRADNVRAALAAIPVERLLLETDAPYLAPVPYRGKRNQPAFLVDIAGYVADQKGLELAELARITTANARRFFRLADAEKP